MERFERIFERVSPRDGGRASCRSAPEGAPEEEAVAEEDDDPEVPEEDVVEEVHAREDARPDARPDAEGEPPEPRGCSEDEVCCKGGSSSNFFKGGWGKGHGFYRCVAGVDKGACKRATDDAGRSLRFKKDRWDPLSEPKRVYVVWNFL